MADDKEKSNDNTGRPESTGRPLEMPRTNLNEGLGSLIKGGGAQWGDNDAAHRGHRTDPEPPEPPQPAQSKD